MEHELRRDRRARLEVQPLEARELMSAGSVTGIETRYLEHLKHRHLEHRQVHATAPQPSGTHSNLKAVGFSGHDPLRALAKVPNPAISAAVTGPDANGSVTISGRTYRRAKVSLDLQADGTIEQTAMANSRGQFQFTFTVGFGSTPVCLSATAHGHKATPTTLTVNRTPPPISTPTSANLPVGAFQFVQSVTDGEYVVTNQLRLDLYNDGTGEIQYELDTGPPLDPYFAERDYWVWFGRWTAHASELEFVGQGTRTRTSEEDPSLNWQYSFNDDLTFPFFQLVQGGSTLDLILADEFHQIEGPNGLTQNIALSKIGQH
jgi:hypothetical protein